MTHHCAHPNATPHSPPPLAFRSMPRGLTAATGMDALTHAIEAYVSTASTPVTE